MWKNLAERVNVEKRKVFHRLETKQERVKACRRVAYKKPKGVEVGLMGNTNIKHNTKK